MRIVLSKTGRYVAKLTLQVVPSVTASVLGGYLLAQLHVASNTSSNDPPARVTGVSADTAHDGVQRAEVKPLETKAAETKSAETKSAEAKPVEPRPAKAKPAAATVAVAEKEKPQEKVQEKPQDKVAEKPAKPRTEPRTTVAAVNPRVAEPYKPIPYDPEPSNETLYVAPPAQAPAAASLTTRPMPPQAPAETAVAQPAPKPAIPQPQAVANAAPPPASSALPQAAPALPPPTTLAPVSVTAPASSGEPRAAEVVVKPEPRRQQVAREDSRGVFSSISSAAGTAANATGDTINWVFGLPGKLIGRGDPDADAPASPPEPRRLM